MQHAAALSLDQPLGLVNNGRHPDVSTSDDQSFHATFDPLPVGIAHTRPEDGGWLRVNQRLTDMLGYSLDELRGLTFHHLTHPDDLADDLAQLDSMLRGEIKSYTLQKRYFHKDGTTVWARVNITFVDEGVGSPYVLAVIEDITEALKDRQALEESEARYRSLVELSPDAIVVVADHRIVYANQAAANLFGGSEDRRLIGVQTGRLIKSGHEQSLLDGITQTIASGKAVDLGDEDLLTLDGTSIDADLQVVGVPVTHRGEAAIQLIVRDVTDQRLAERQLKHQATHDSLTGLPNRDLLRTSLTKMLDGQEQSLALLLMDLDRFKDINDTFGHHYGDLLLADLGRRLQGLFDERTTLARLGGDEFAIVLPSTGESGAREAASQLLETVGEPFVLEGKSLEVGASIGIVLFPEQGRDSHELLRRADIAMYLAKRERKGFAQYDLSRDQHSPQRLHLMSELKNAIDRNQLLLHYQPKALLRTGEIRSAEALLRWVHPDRGMIPPDEFIPLAEHGGLIDRLSIWVLNSALQQVHAWRASGREVTVAVNLSPRNLYDPDLIPTIDQMLKRWRVDASALKLELTETAIMDDPETAMTTLTRLHRMGVRISIDDFGTGYSSLGYLKRLPVDEIKIDRSFVTDMVDHTDDAFIVRSTIDLGHNLGLQVVAEGVEDQRTWDLLGVLGCDMAQGYFLSRPVSAPELTSRLVRMQKR